MPMQIKKFEHEGVIYAVLDDKGLPVYVHDDGKEIGFDAISATNKITALQGEAMGHRKDKEAALESLKKFEGIADPAAALKAIETVANLDAKKLIDAGEVEKVKAEAKKAFDEQLDAERKKWEPVIAERDALKDKLVQERIGRAFSGSKYITDNLAVPFDMVQATFGARFKVEEDAIVAYDAAGNKLYSRARPGELATFDEALEQLVEAYPNRDYILKGAGANGGGGPGGGGRGDGKQKTRAEFEEMAPAKRMEFVNGGGKVVD